MDSTGSKPILLISPLPPPFGGIATWTRIVIDHGLPDKHPLSLVNTRLRGKRNIFDKAGFSLYEVIRTLHVFCNLIYQLIINRPKLIHLNCSLSPAGVMRDAACAQIAALFKIPLVSQYHGNLPDFNENRFFGLSRLALLRLMKITKMNILTNQLSLQKAQQFGFSSTLKLLPNFIEDDIFSYKKNAAANARCQAIFAGGITRAKGCAEILTLARLMPEIDFHLYGRMHADMAAPYQRHPANIFLHDVVSHEKLLHAMCASDFLLFPSHSEGFPLTVLEAMTIGLPVIATKVGAIPEMVADAKGGYLVECGDTAALIRAVESIQDNAALRSAMGAFNRQKSYNEYRYSIVMRQLQTIYEHIQTCVE